MLSVSFFQEITIARDARASPRALEAELEEWGGVFERALIMLRLSPPLRRRHGD